MRVWMSVSMFALFLASVWTVPACSPAPNQETTTDSGTPTEKTPGEGTSFKALSADGYTTVSDVVSHNKVTQDIGDIKEMLQVATVEWDKIQQLYEKGKHSVKGDGSVRTLNGFASAPGNFIKYSPDASAYFKTKGICQLAPVDGFKCTEGKFVDEYVEAYAMKGTGPFAQASAKARGAAIRSGLLVLMSYWVRLELGKSLALANENKFDPADGSPHNWDEAFAFYWGPEGKHSLYALAKELSDKYSLSSSINDEFMKALIEGLQQQTDKKTVPTEAADAAKKQLLRLFVLASLDAAKMLDAASDDDAKAEARWLGFGYWMAIGHAITKADASAETTFQDVFFTKKINTDTYKALQEAVKKALPGMGFTDADFGTALQ